MKKIFLLTSLFICANSLKAQTCYWYVTASADEDFEVYKGESLKKIFSNIIGTTDCDYNDDVSIEIEFAEAIKAKYPETYFYVDSHIAWRFDTRNEAEKDRRKEIGDFKSDAWKVIEFSFTYYGDD